VIYLLTTFLQSAGHRFEDHQLWYPDCNTNNIYITSEQDLIISYCKVKEDPSDLEDHGEPHEAFMTERPGQR
jgi:hypothetical protein